MRDNGKMEKREYRREPIIERILKACSSPIPITITEIGRRVFPSKRPDKAGEKIRPLINELVEQGLIVKINKGTRAWKLAKELNKRFLETKPRRAGNLYITHFLVYLEKRYNNKNNNKSKAKTLFLPSIDPEMNLAIIAMLERVLRNKQVIAVDLPLEFLNLALLSKSKEEKDKIRLFLYSLPADYPEIEALEKILDYGSTIDLPFKPDMERARMFLTDLFRQPDQNTGTKGGPRTPQ